MKAFGFLAFVSLALTAVAEPNPHDGYMFWMPNGELKPSDSSTWKAFDYTKTNTGERFTIKPRMTRFDAPRQQFVIVQVGKWLPNDIGKSKQPPTIRVDGTPIGAMGQVVFIPQELTVGKQKVTVEYAIPGNFGRQKEFTYRIYATDDADKLGMKLDGDAGNTGPSDPAMKYKKTLVAFWGNQYAWARDSWRSLAAKEKNPDAARLYRRLARWAEGEISFDRIKTGESFYNLGLYAMVNGFWDLAEKSLKRATDLMPKNPDAWYLYADALSYKTSDLDNEMARIAPFYRKAADLYPRENSNTFRTYLGLFRNLKVKEGNDTKVIHMSDEQIAHVKKNWEWCSTIMEAASRGTLRMVNTYKEYDQEFDSTRDWDPRPFAGLFKPGEVDTFMKLTGWGASDCCGMDTGPDRSAFVNMGIREWDVMLHEWNHSLDWAMISDELGVGVPETHASDWCGFEPISSMGMGHHSCNRYYMTPGMYRFVKGSTNIESPRIDAWQVAGPYKLRDDVTDLKKLDEAYYKDMSARTSAVVPPSSDEYKVKGFVKGGYCYLNELWPQAGKNSYAFAKTFIYSPTKQKVRMWLTADQNARIWLNGRQVRKGLYWSTCQFRGKVELDQVSGALMLEKGWNSFVMQVTSNQQGVDWQTDILYAPTWGFSVRLCDIKDQAIPGVKWQAEQPSDFKTPELYTFNAKAPKTFNWWSVAEDYTALLPELSVKDLSSLTGSILDITNEMLFGYQVMPKGGLPYPWMVNSADPKSIKLDNQLNWFFSPKELTAVFRYQRNGKTRDLLFIKPEGYEAFLKLMPVSAQAKKLGIKSHADQVIGYLTVPRSDSALGRIVLVVDTYLGDRLPTDEEDLLSVKSLK
jgi:hypothetical protein